MFRRFVAYSPLLALALLAPAVGQQVRVDNPLGGNGGMKVECWNGNTFGNCNTALITDGVDAAGVTGNSLNVDFPKVETYTAGIFASAAGAGKDFLNLFNASGSGVVLKVHNISAGPQLSAAVTGLVQSFLIRRVSDVGATCTAVPIEKLDTNNAALPAQVTSSTNCTTDPTSVANLLICAVDGEETRQTNAFDGNCYRQYNSTEQPITLREGEGLTIISSALSGGWPVFARIVFTKE